MDDFEPRKLFLFGRDTIVPSPFRTYRTPRALALSEATYLGDDDEVMAVNVRGTVRGYPVRVVAPHHIVEDRVGDAHVTVTF